MAARSTRVTVRNQTDVTLHYIDDSLEHGIWTDPLSPPAEIGPGATMWWQSESDGIRDWHGRTCPLRCSREQRYCHISLGQPVCRCELLRAVGDGTLWYLLQRRDGQQH